LRLALGFYVSYVSTSN